ncbi:YiiX family permuted papain-like enzyme [Hymenobacter sp. 5317J-9]|uniref:YiiX family permuted papain-like enzyme n=1 Tax=Hymenobacter sp. 5317J-9 TaxID=2932250 RepID=UPI001FD6F63D|nr:YiiX family permuted papain-like enzyme [Hymenobacter sp. 5317J-9]UOQ96308.1 YiiX family permuted papain-like enzyme [Hymenobacter sp. 5317J-9]
MVTFALLISVFAYPRLHRRLLRFQGHRAAAAATAQIAPQLREGDLIFHTSLSAQSRAIQLATHSPYSHCGILYQRDGQWQVFEAVQPVKLTPLADWVERGQDGHFVTKRLRDAATALTPSALARLKAAGQPMLGHNYDLYFGWSDDRIYCSELIWKVYERGLGRRLGKLQQLRDFDLSHPAVQAKLRERYGNQLPLQETVISPASIFRSPELVTVLSR